MDRFLADQISISRTQSARLIADGAVLVNGDVARASRKLVQGDTLTVSALPEDQPREVKPYQIDLEVVFEDAHLLVVNKPAGLVVHPAPGHWQDTLVNALMARGTEHSLSGSERPGLVHRLDRDTSGLMVVAKTDLAHRRLTRALVARRVDRVYVALVWGHPAGRIIDAPVGRHPRDRKRMMVIATGRPARTTVEHLARFDSCDLVRLTLDTGRTHQIRVHMAHIGHPVVGDPVYGGGGPGRVTGPQRPLAEAISRLVSRQALHAAILRFPHPESGRLTELRSDWPDDLTPALQLASGEDSLAGGHSRLESFGFFPPLEAS